MTQTLVAEKSVVDPLRRCFSARAKSFGGELRRASLEGVPEFKRMGAHYWNGLPDGSEEDFTRQQFGENYPAGCKPQPGSFSIAIFAGNRKAYKLLAFRLARAVNEDNEIFDI